MVCGASMVAFLAASIMTLTAIILPRWISWDTTTSAGTRIHYTYGLQRRCSSISQTCEYFPQDQDCQGHDRYFCSMWRTVGFLMSFSVVLQGMTLVAYVAMLAGGRQKRETGWKVLACFLLLTGLVQCASMAIIAFLYDHDDRFFVGWKLDKSWIMCTLSWSILILSAGFLSASAFLLPSEGGYESIQSTD